MTTTEFYEIVVQELPFISFGIDVVEGYMEQCHELRSLSASDLSANQIDLFMDYVLSQDLCDEVEL